MSNIGVATIIPCLGANLRATDVENCCIGADINGLYQVTTEGWSGCVAAAGVTASFVSCVLNVQPNTCMATYSSLSSAQDYISSTNGCNGNHDTVVQLYNALNDNTYTCASDGSMSFSTSSAGARFSIRIVFLLLLTVFAVLNGCFGIWRMLFLHHSSQSRFTFVINEIVLSRITFSKSFVVCDAVQFRMSIYPLRSETGQSPLACLCNIESVALGCRVNLSKGARERSDSKWIWCYKLPSH